MDDFKENEVKSNFLEMIEILLIILGSVLLYCYYFYIVCAIVFASLLLR